IFTSGWDVQLLVTTISFGCSTAFVFVTKAMAVRAATRHSAGEFARAWVTQLRAGALGINGELSEDPSKPSGATARITERIATLHARTKGEMSADAAERLRMKILKWIETAGSLEQSSLPAWSSDHDAFVRLHNEAVREWTFEHGPIGLAALLAR